MTLALTRHERWAASAPTSTTSPLLRASTALNNPLKVAESSSRTIPLLPTCSGKRSTEALEIAMRPSPRFSEPSAASAAADITVDSLASSWREGCCLFSAQVSTRAMPRRQDRATHALLPSLEAEMLQSGIGYASRPPCAISSPSSGVLLRPDALVHNTPRVLLHRCLFTPQALFAAQAMLPTAIGVTTTESAPYDSPSQVCVCPQLPTPTQPTTHALHLCHWQQKHRIRFCRVTPPSTPPLLPIALLRRVRPDHLRLLLALTPPPRKTAAILINVAPTTTEDVFKRISSRHHCCASCLSVRPLALQPTPPCTIPSVAFIAPPWILPDDRVHGPHILT